MYKYFLAYLQSSNHGLLSLIISLPLFLVSNPPVRRIHTIIHSGLEDEITIYISEKFQACESK